MKLSAKQERALKFVHDVKLYQEVVPRSRCVDIKQYPAAIKYLALARKKMLTYEYKMRIYTLMKGMLEIQKLDKE